MKRLIMTGLVFLCAAVPSHAQTVRASQFATVSQKIATTTVSVDYSRPVARGRTLFGPEGIVKYKKIWMPGANEASFLKTDSNILVNGKPLKAGSYSFWTIPGEKKWTVILSTDWDQWHTRYPGEDKDALRFEVEPEKGAHMETLAFYFPVVTRFSAQLRLHWGSTIIPMEISLAAKTLDKLTSSMPTQVPSLPVNRKIDLTPKVTFQEGFAIAQRFVKESRIDVSDYYLSSGKFFLYGETEENSTPAWMFQWMNNQGRTGDYVTIVVSTKDGSAWQLPSM